MRLLQLLRREVQFQVNRFAKLFGFRGVQKNDVNEATTTASKTPTNWVKFAFRSIAALAALGLLSVILLFISVQAGVFGKLPTQDMLLHVENHNASEVYSEDGQLLFKYFIENRSDVDYTDLSSNVIYALICTEDARFYKHSGVDYRATARVLFKSVLLRQPQAGGGSTISQQLAKNLYPRQRYNSFSIVINKVQEIIIARRLERVYSKEGLLNLYLNTVPFSHNVFGIKVAAERFFDKDPKDLKLEEAAVLIGMLKATTYYDPVRNPERAEERRNVVLRQLERYDYLKKEVCDSLTQIPMTLDYNPHKDRGKARYYKTHIQSELQDILSSQLKTDNTPYSLYSDGLRVYTTLDSKMQDYAEDAVKQHIAKLQKTFDRHWKGRKPYRNYENLMRELRKSDRYKRLKARALSDKEILEHFKDSVQMRIFDREKGEVKVTMTPLDSVKYYIAMLHAGFLAAEPSTGKIKAWVGGIDYGHFQYDHVKSKRQIGSIFKPIVYTEAIKQGISPCNYFQNVLVSYPDWENWQPSNADGKYGGFYSMAGGLSKSINTITVEVLFQTKINPVRKLGKAMGIEGYIPEGPAIGLGAVEASLYEMVTAYTTYANRGTRKNLYSIERVEDSDGNILYEASKTAQKRLLTEKESDTVLKLLESVVDSGTARSLRNVYGLNGAIAGKTGTTQNQSDGWFLGVTPNLVAGAWVGAESPRIHFRTLSLGQGAKTALPIWGLFMRSVYRDKSFRSIRRAKFPTPSEEVLQSLDCDAFISDEALDVAYFLEEENGARLFDGLFNRRDTFNFTEEDLKDGIDPKEMENLEARMEKKRKRDKLKNIWKDKLFRKKEKDEG